MHELKPERKRTCPSFSDESTCLAINIGLHELKLLVTKPPEKEMKSGSELHIGQRFRKEKCTGIEQKMCPIQDDVLNIFDGKKHVTWESCLTERYRGHVEISNIINRPFFKFSRIEKW